MTTLHISTSVTVRQLDKGQDHVIITRGQLDYINGKLCDIIECYDGHGNNECIDYIKEMDTTDIIQCFREPELEIQRMIDNSYEVSSVKSGAVCAFAKIYDNYMELRNVGDVQICVYINHTLVYHSIQHDSYNITEFERVKATGLATYESMKLPEVLNPDDITFIDYNLFLWKHGFSLYPTQSLGHKGITGIFPEVKIIEFSEKDDIVVIVATDGLWDVVNPTYDVLHSYSSEELADLAECRWKKTWNVIDNENPENIVKNHFTKGDDIGIAVWRRA